MYQKFKLEKQMPLYITSRTNTRFQNALKLIKSASTRDETGCFAVEGLKLCIEAAQTNELVEIFYTEKDLQRFNELENITGQHCIISQQLAQKLTNAKTPIGVLGIFKKPILKLQELQPKGRYILLEQLGDPQNLGAILRSALAFSFTGVIITKGCADAYSTKTIRASAGASLKIPIIYADNLVELVQNAKARGYIFVATALENAVVPQNYTEKTSLIIAIGNEGKGLSREIVSLADCVVKIPTNHVESLNAAVAAGILMYIYRG